MQAHNGGRYCCLSCCFYYLSSLPVFTAAFFPTGAFFYVQLEAFFTAAFPTVAYYCGAPTAEADYESASFVHQSKASKASKADARRLRTKQHGRRGSRDQIRLD
jgi:hypothetical protein